MCASKVVEQNAKLPDDELIAKLDHPYKWELLTGETSFDTHYHTLREALVFVIGLVKSGQKVGALSRMDRSIFVDHDQVLRMVDLLVFRPQAE